MSEFQKNKLKKFHFENNYFSAPTKYGQLLLFQAGDISCKGGYSIPAHVQECYELSLIVSGEGVYRTNGLDYPVSAGDLCLNLPGQLHEGIADSHKPFRYYYIGFDFVDSTDEHIGYMGIKEQFDSMDKDLVVNNSVTKNMFAGLLGELLHPKAHSAQMVSLYLQQIVISAHRAYSGGPAFVYPVGQEPDNVQQLVYQIVNYIDSHLLDLIELTDISEELGYSYSYISHLFTKEMGFSIQSYYNERRLKKAADMLASRQYSITQIAEQLNYSSIHAFSRAFKNHYLVPPSKFRFD